MLLIQNKQASKTNRISYAIEMQDVRPFVPSDATTSARRIYSLALEIANKNVDDAQRIVKEFYSDLVGIDANKNPVEFKQRMIEFARDVIYGDKNKQQALIKAIATDLIHAMNADPKESYKISKFVSTVFENSLAILTRENTSANLIPYFMFLAPLLRFMYPNMVATALYDVRNMAAPGAYIYFLKFFDEMSGGNTNYPFAAYLGYDSTSGRLTPGQDFAYYGTAPGQFTTITPGTPATEVVIRTNVYTELRNDGFLPAASIIPDSALRVQPDLRIVSVLVSDGSTTVEIPVNSNIESSGIFYGSGTTTVGATTYTCQVNGKVDFKTGDIMITAISTTPGFNVTEVRVSARVAYEQRNPARRLNIELARQPLAENRIEKTLIVSPELNYDAQALFNLDLVGEVSAILSAIVALDTDAFLLMNAYNSSLVHGVEYNVDITPATLAAFPWGPGMYIMTHVPFAISNVLGRLLRNTPVPDVEPVLIMSSEDAALLVNVGKWASDPVTKNEPFKLSLRNRGDKEEYLTVHPTPVLPPGVNILGLKSKQELFSIAIYAPYATLMIPYPATTQGPAMTAVHRFGANVLYPQAIGRLRFTR